MNPAIAVGTRIKWRSNHNDKGTVTGFNGDFDSNLRMLTVLFDDGMTGEYSEDWLRVIE